MRRALLAFIGIVAGCGGATELGAPSRGDAPRHSLTSSTPSDWARRLLLGDGAVVDVAAATRIFDEECRLRFDLGACEAYDSLSSVQSLEGDEAAEFALRALCTDGDRWACGSAWAMVLHLVNHIASTNPACDVPPPGAQPHYTCEKTILDLCDQGVPYACGHAANIVLVRAHGRELTKEEEARVAAWEEKGCVLGDSVSCEFLARYHTQTEAAWQRYVETAKRNCAAGWAGDCSVYFDGAKGCRMNPRPSCEKLSFVPRQIVEHCLMGDSAACMWVPPSQPETEEKVGRMACALWDVACASFVQFAVDVRHDLEGARSFVYSQCREGHAKACALAAELYERAPADPVKAEAARTSACWYGVEAACKGDAPAATATESGR